MMHGEREQKPQEKRRKIQWSKLMTLLVILLGFVIVQECFVLMYLCIRYGYTSTAAWLTAAVGLAEAVMAAGISGYLALCKSDHREGGVTYETAKAAGFRDGSAVNGGSRI